YDVDGKFLYSSYDDKKVKEYIYLEGKLLGVWDYTDYSLSVIIHNQEVARLLVEEKPDEKTIQEWVSKGYIKKEYTSNQLALAPSKYEGKLSKEIISLYQPREPLRIIESKNKEFVGYDTEDGSFIPIQITYFNKNGLVEKKEDIISGKIQEFDKTGKVVRAYSKLIIYEDNILKEKIYEAKVEYTQDGSYSIFYPDIIDMDGDPNTYKDRTVIDDAQVEHYSFDGRLLSVVSKNFVEGKFETSEIKYIYDTSGYVVKKEIIGKNGKLLSETYYKHSLEQYTIRYVYDNNEKLLGSYVSSQNFYKGKKLIKTENYELEDLSVGLTKLVSTIEYDKHSRISKVKDALDRVIQKYFYNDKKKPDIISVKIENYDEGPYYVKIKITPGGVKYSEQYTYSQEGIQNTIRTYYHNGNIEWQAISYLK
ncbi:MAG: hypothetical protein ACK4WJ_06040, partial [Endomicrobiia bacterium]